MADESQAVEVSDIVSVSVRLPNDEFIELQVKPDTAISQLMCILESHHLGLKGSKIHLLFRQKRMDPALRLDQYNSDKEVSLRVDAVVDCTDDLDLRYEDFLDGDLRLSTRSQNLKKVSVEAYFTIRCAGFTSLHYLLGFYFNLLRQQRHLIHALVWQCQSVSK
jgi:hypothetical protein